jgi:hypothetical protein
LDIDYRGEKQVPRRIAKSATLARDDDASPRRQIVDQKGIVDQGVKRVKLGIFQRRGRRDAEEAAAKKQVPHRRATAFSFVSSEG